LDLPNSILDAALQGGICLCLLGNAVELFGTQTTILRDFLGSVAEIDGDFLCLSRQISQSFRLVTGEIAGGTANNLLNLAVGLLAVGLYLQDGASVVLDLGIGEILGVGKIIEIKIGKMLGNLRYSPAKEADCR
jgi:hypothetical protein